MALLLASSIGFSQSAIAAAPAEVTTVTVPRNNPDYAKIFAQFDKGYNKGRGASDEDNSKGSLAWLQSYFMLGYMQQYRATGDTHWLDQLVEQFDRVLAKRDDRVGRQDIYTSAPLKGWGTATYDKAGWHVFVVHTGMICQGPAEFVFEVKADQKLQDKYGAAAARFLKEIEAMVADADQYFKVGDAAKGEGWYADPKTGIVPLNMSSAMGTVLVHLYRITGEPAYRARATKLATFFKNCLRDNGAGGYNWAYWPKTSSPAEKFATGEDISHAALNVGFATACAGIDAVFTKDDLDKFANTWLKKVSKGNGEWAAFVDGTGSAVKMGYIPQAAGRWLSLIPRLTDELATKLYADVIAAFAGQEIYVPSRALGVANLEYYKKVREDAAPE